MAIWNKTRQSLNSNNNQQYEVVMLADKDGNILNSSGAASNIPIAAGEVGGYSHINKFGYSDNILFLSTVWDGSNIYTYSTSAGVVTISGTDDDDGAVIEIQGLDANYNIVVQDVTLDGDGDGTASTNLIRIFRARVKTPTDGATSNVADLSILIAGQERAKILAENGQTLMALYTVPAGKTAYLLNLTLYVDKNVDVIYKLIAREIDDGGFQIKGQYGTFGTPIDHNFPVPLKFTEKTDIEIQADAGNTAGGGATFDLILVDNPS